jgi:hypothetical protein
MMLAALGEEAVGAQPCHVAFQELDLREWDGIGRAA